MTLLRRIAFILLLLLCFVASGQPPYHGVPTGTITYNAGVAKLISTSYITLPAGTFPSSPPWTIEMRMKPTTINWEVTVGSGTNWGIGRGPAPYLFAFVGSPYIYPEVSGPDIVTPGTMQHIVLSNTDGTSIRAFVNGVHVGTTTATIPALTGTATIGGGANPFTGEIDSLIVWNIDKYPGTTSFTPTVSWANNTSGIRAKYDFDGNADDSFNGTTPLVSGTLTRVTGLEYAGYQGGVGNGTVQLESYVGACGSGTFTTDGTAFTSQAANTVVRWARDGTVRCYRVRTDSGAETVYSGTVTSPLAGGGPRSY